MITLKASGNGGPILLSLSGCLVGSEARCEWHWNWFLLQGKDDVRGRNLLMSRRASRIWPSRALTHIGDGTRRATSRTRIDKYIFQRLTQQVLGQTQYFRICAHGPSGP